MSGFFLIPACFDKNEKKAVSGLWSGNGNGGFCVAKDELCSHIVGVECNNPEMALIPTEKGFILLKGWVGLLHFPRENTLQLH